MSEDKKKQQLCAFITLLQTLGYDITVMSGDSLKKKGEKK